jgi:hypothetical protein
LKGVEELLTTSDLVASFCKSAQQLAIERTLIETLPPRSLPDVTFLFKGLRGMVIEKIVWAFGSLSNPLHTPWLNTQLFQFSMA